MYAETSLRPGAVLELGLRCASCVVVKRYPLKGEAKVLCAPCIEMLVRLSLTDRPRVPFSELPESLSSLFCGRCGALLGPSDPEQVLLGKLSQLSQFGLGVDQGPLLKPPPVRKR